MKDFFVVSAVMMLAHLISDAFLQSREEAKGKSEDKKILFKHVSTNYVVTFVFLTVTFSILTYGFGLGILFSILRAGIISFWNAAIHALIDWNIWRLYKKSVEERIKKQQEHCNKYEITALPFKYWEDPWFFHTIMIDQFLHYLTVLVLAGLATGAIFT